MTENTTVSFSCFVRRIKGWKEEKNRGRGGRGWLAGCCGGFGQKQSSPDEAPPYGLSQPQRPLTYSFPTHPRVMISPSFAYEREKETEKRIIEKLKVSPSPRWSGLVSWNSKSLALTWRESPARSRSQKHESRQPARRLGPTGRLLSDATSWTPKASSLLYKRCRVQVQVYLVKPGVGNALKWRIWDNLTFDLCVHYRTDVLFSRSMLRLERRDQPL